MRRGPLKTLPGTAEATVRALGYGTLGAGAMPVAVVSATRCERTCLQVSVRVWEPQWEQSMGTDVYVYLGCLWPRLSGLRL